MFTDPMFETTQIFDCDGRFRKTQVPSLRKSRKVCEITRENVRRLIVEHFTTLYSVTSEF